VVSRLVVPESPADSTQSHEGHQDAQRNGVGKWQLRTPAATARADALCGGSRKRPPGNGL